MLVVGVQIILCTVTFYLVTVLLTSKHNCERNAFVQHTHIVYTYCSGECQYVCRHSEFCSEMQLCFLSPFLSFLIVPPHTHTQKC